MRNILLIIDETTDAHHLYLSTLQIAQHCQANILICQITESDEEVISDHNWHPGAGFAELSGPQSAVLWSAREDVNIFSPRVTYLKAPSSGLTPMRELVADFPVWLIVCKKRTVEQIRTRDLSPVWHVAEKMSCPVLLIPDDAPFQKVSNVAYLTVIRYCSDDILKFLKIFGTAIYVTHLTAPGLVPVDERYAQDLLANQVAARVNCSKLFLRNICDPEVCPSIENKFEFLDISILAFFCRYHSVLERMIGEKGELVREYQRLPLLIFPYGNWIPFA